MWKFDAVAVTAFFLMGSPVLADGDVAKGKAIFSICAPCHNIDVPKNRLGPHLVGVIGRHAASVADYKYSRAMTDAGANGLIWDEASLTDYLLGPKSKVPGTKMAFSGLKKSDDIANIIAYLKMHSPP